MNYFKYSQIIKQEIDSTSSLIKTIKEIYQGEKEEFSFGGSVNLYRVGLLGSGVYLANLRD